MGSRSAWGAQGRPVAGSVATVLRTVVWMAVLLLGMSPSISPAQQKPGLRFPDESNRLEVQTIQSAERDQKPLPSQIESMPDIQQEMEVIHRRSQLMIAREKIVRTAVADPSVIDVVQYSPSELSIIGLQVGSTTLTIWFEGQPEPLIYLVEVIPDPSIQERRRVDYGKLEKKLGVLFPNSNVYLIPLSNKIVVKGQARDAETAAQILQIVRGEVLNQQGDIVGQPPFAGGGGGGGAGFDPNRVGGLGGVGGFGQLSSFIVNMLEIPGEFQVMLRVRVAELNRSQLRRMGVDLDALFNDGRHILTSTLGGLPATLTGIFENGEINVLVNWLASNNTAKILAEPTLTVLSGHTASFLSGGEFAVPTIVGVNGAQGTTTRFRGFGTSLIVTPTVLDKDLIRMRIVPSFSQINTGNSVQGIPGLNSRRVQTTVQLREGQTLALAGLFSHQTDVENNRVPYLGNIPFLGPTLFNTKRSSQDQKELLILVSPEIVRPMDSEEVPPQPGFESTVPDDVSLYFRGMTEGPPDTGVYQLPPYGRGSGHGTDVGYRLFNPAPASPLQSPVPTDPYGTGYSPPPGSSPQQSGSRPGIQGGRQFVPPSRGRNMPNRQTPPPAPGATPRPSGGTGGVSTGATQMRNPGIRPANTRHGAPPGRASGMYYRNSRPNSANFRRNRRR